MKVLCEISFFPIDRVGHFFEVMSVTFENCNCIAKFTISSHIILASALVCCLGGGTGGNLADLIRNMNLLECTCCIV
jgi:hypothetical protein